MGVGWANSRTRRALDLVFATGGLLLVWPLLLALALLVSLDSPGPPFFAQRRAGLRLQPFWMLKFRTMVRDAERQLPDLRAQANLTGPVFKLEADPRVTQLGRWLRRTSLDELPQLLNVVLGSMSLVGPRPLPLDQLDPAEPRFARRCDVPPGLTGLWQVQGRTMHTDYDRWLNEDCEYVDRASPALDGDILARTWSAVRRGTGAY